MNLKFKAFREFVAIYMLLFIVYLVLLPKTAHGWDMYCWKEWCIFIFNEGLSKIYSSPTDYLPLYHYFLWIFAHFQGNVISIQNNIIYLKIITLAFDFLAGFYLIKLIKPIIYNSYQTITLSLFYFLNISIFYNTLLWGQVDGFLTCFIFISFYYAYRGNINATILFYILAFYFKIQAIIFLPLLGLMILPTIVQTISFKKLVIWILLIITLQVLILAPFIFSGSVYKIWNVIVESFGKYPVVSMNADNIWVLLLKGSLIETQDSVKAFGISYHNWGLIMFTITLFFSLYPLIKGTYASLKFGTTNVLSLDKLLITGTLIPLLFFYFNTQMHERYCHPAFIFLISFCIIKNNAVIGILLSVAYFLNLEEVLRFLQLQNYGTLIFNKMFISGLFLISIILLFSELYELNFLKRRLKPDALN